MRTVCSALTKQVSEPIQAKDDQLTFPGMAKHVDTHSTKHFWSNDGVHCAIAPLKDLVKF
eukprot:1156785-Pelagomonas_calceolata.AAC.7